MAVVTDATLRCDDGGGGVWTCTDNGTVGCPTVLGNRQNRFRGSPSTDLMQAKHSAMVAGTANCQALQAAAIAEKEAQENQRRQEELARQQAAAQAAQAAATQEAIRIAEQAQQDALASNTQVATQAAESSNRSTETSARVAAGAISTTAAGLDKALETQTRIAQATILSGVPNEIIFAFIAIGAGVLLTNKKARKYIGL